MLTRCPRPVGSGIPGIRGGLQVGPVRRQQTVSLKTSGGAQAGGKPLEKRLHRCGQQLLPLLDKCRGRRCVLHAFKALNQSLSQAVFAHGEQQGYHRLKTQCPGPGEVSSGPPNKPFRCLPQFPNQRMQDLPQYTWCVFHVHLPPEKQFHFSGLHRTLFRICQAFFMLFSYLFSYTFNLMTLLNLRRIFRQSRRGHLSPGVVLQSLYSIKIQK